MGMIFNYETVESVEVWLRDWEDVVLKEPENIVLGRTLSNVLELVLAELRGLSPKKRAKGIIQRNELGQGQWAREMLELLEQEFVNDAYGRIAMFRRHCPAEIDALEQEVRRGHFDVVGVEAAAVALLQVDWYELLWEELRLELAKGKAYDRQALRLISNLLCELALKRHTPKELKSIPRAVFTREYTRFLLTEHGDKVVASASAAHAFDHAVDWVSSAEAKVLADTTLTESDSLFDISTSTFWQFSVYELIRMIQGWVEDAFATTSSSRGETREVPVAADWNALAHGLALVIVEKYTVALCAQGLRVQFKEQLKSSENTPPVAFVNLLVDAILKRCGFGNIKMREEEGELRYGAAREALRQSLLAPLARVLSEAVSSREWTTDSQAESLVVEMSDWLASELQDIFAGPETSSVPLAQEAVLSASQELVCRRSFHEALWIHLKPLTALFIDDLEAREVRSPAADTEPSDMLQGLWTDWKDTIPAFAETYHLFHSLPWKDLSGTCLNALVSALSLVINQPFEEWVVFYKVHALDCVGAKWKLGKVLFYDPKVYDFGEGEIFYPQLQSTENLVGISVDVTANSRFEARTKAHAWAEEALDVVSFALSVGRDLGGLNPRILPQVFEMRKISPGYWSGQAGAPPSVTPTSVNKIQEKERGILELYDSLLLDSESNSSSLSEIQQLFLKAVRWYRMGRWQDDPIESFLFHWIALESMFAAGEREVERLLLEHVPRLEVNGCGVLGTFWLWWAEDWKAVIKGIKDCPALLKRVEQDADLDGWDHYYHVLLDTGNVDRLEQHTTGASCNSEKAIRDWISKVRNVDAVTIKEEIERRQEASKYRLHVMYVRRNLIVHEAHSFRDASDMAIYAQELKGLLETVLRLAAAEATNPCSPCQTVQDLIELANRPW